MGGYGAGPSAPTTQGTAKKSTAKKSTAKKSTAKKSTAKKSTAKKSTAKEAVVDAAALPISGADPSGEQPNDSKSVTQVAEECLAGSRRWGTGRERDITLREAGFDPEEVRREISRLRSQKRRDEA